MEDIDYYKGYTIPSIHISKLQDLLDRKTDSISKTEIIDLFLSFHGLTLEKIKGNKIIPQIRYEKIKDLIDDGSDYQLIIDEGNPNETHFYESEFSIRIKRPILEGFLYIFYNAGINSPLHMEILSIDLWFPWQTQLNINSEFIEEFSENKTFILSAEVLGKQINWSYNGSNNSKALNSSFKKEFEENSEYKKLNIEEIIKDAQYQFTHSNEEEIISLYRYFQSEFEIVNQFHKAYLGVGNTFLENREPITRYQRYQSKNHYRSFIDEIPKDNGTFVEFTIENINKEKWEEVKSSLIKLSIYLYNSRPS